MSTDIKDRQQSREIPTEELCQMIKDATYAHTLIKLGGDKLDKLDWTADKVRRGLIGFGSVAGGMAAGSLLANAAAKAIKKRGGGEAVSNILRFGGPAATGALAYIGINELRKYLDARDDEHKRGS